jgi:hypothetical protein
MRASRTAPAGYAPAGSVVLDGNPRLKWWLTVASLLLLVVGWYLFAAVATALRPELSGLSLTFASPTGALLLLVAVVAVLLLVTVLVLVVHEAVHGLLFWVYTRARPQFGFKGWYAYASAPGWYLSRNRFLVVGLGPVVVLSSVGLALVLVLPPAAATAVLFGMALNIAGSVGDGYLCARLLALPASAVVEDRPDGIAWHTGPPDEGGR